MRLASVLTPFSDYNLQLAAQCGVTDVVTRYPGRELFDLVSVRDHARRFGLRLAAIEGHLPIESVKVGGSQRDVEIEEMKRLIRNMAAADIPICCYTFMAGTDWVRTRLDAKERGGALVTAFDQAEAERAAVSLRGEATRVSNDPISADELWQNLEHFLCELVPVAESSGVLLCMHPD